MLWLTVLAVWWCASGCGAVPARDKPFYPASAHAQHFAVFKSTHHKQYATPEEEQHRFNAFKKNLATINKLNANDEHAVYDINGFADWTEKEIEASHMKFDVTKIIMRSRDGYLLDNNDYSVTDAPEALDWRDKGVVTKVEDQKNCRSDWAFAMIGNLEGQHAIKNKHLIEFSKQQLVDCDKYDSGCKCGDVYHACGYLNDVGAMKEDDYKYVAANNNTCAFKPEKVVVHVNSCIVFEGGETQVKSALFNRGPLAAMIDERNLLFYSSGIVTQCEFKSYNHGVLITGYGFDEDVPFWTLKNWHSDKWGENGYVRIKRGVSCIGIGGLNTVISAHI